MLKEIELSQLNMNPFELIAKDWMLICAGDEQKFNMMTASWGSIGIMWGKNVTNIVVRPQRYTLEFIEKQDYYALSFFDSTYKKALSYCGSHSGRDVDKQKETGLTPVFDSEAPYFAEAKLVFICQKLFHQTLDPKGFVDPSFDTQFYAEKDYHNLFVGEIVKVLVSD